MHRTRKYIAALCAVLLLAGCVMGLLGAAAARQAQVYFMAVNETILDLNAETMPMMIQPAGLCAYTMFDPNTTGVDLGVYTSYGNSTLMIYSRSAGALIFDLANDTVTSSLGDDFSSTAEGSVPRAIIRNSTVFVPGGSGVRLFWTGVVPAGAARIRICGPGAQQRVCAGQRDLYAGGGEFLPGAV